MPQVTASSSRTANVSPQPSNREAMQAGSRPPKPKKEGIRMSRTKFQTLTEQMFYILLCLRQECCGTDIMSMVEQLTEGRVRIGPGTLYHLLDQFATEKMIVETKQEGRKRSYVLTDYGREVLEKEYERLLSQIENYREHFKR